MIKNVFQLKRVHERVSELRQLLPTVMDKEYPSGEEHIKQATINNMLAEIDKLLAEIDEFQKLESGETDLPPIDVVIEAADIMTKWRIKKGLSNIELANLAGLSAKDVELFEMGDFEEAPFKMLIALASAIRDYQEQ